ncbi:hypothetical protein EVG20_g9415 [Dentipellis fragilis]|uniref:non-specific serine/threonine protein kinase n=1 Tax=Dentipellis fragilis TaxID=205917 RepID=A0A4Y9XYJ5_9AGAM|nr:hypothetical protein EVG20_g9415 [Dentipellis fragilis]
MSGEAPVRARDLAVNYLSIVERATVYTARSTPTRVYCRIFVGTRLRPGAARRGLQLLNDRDEDGPSSLPVTTTRLTTHLHLLPVAWPAAPRDALHGFRLRVFRSTATATPSSSASVLHLDAFKTTVRFGPAFLYTPAHIPLGPSLTENKDKDGNEDADTDMEGEDSPCAHMHEGIIRGRVYATDAGRGRAQRGSRDVRDDGGRGPGRALDAPPAIRASRMPDSAAHSQCAISRRAASSASRRSTRRAIPRRAMCASCAAPRAACVPARRGEQGVSDLMDHDLLTHISKGPSPDQIRKWMAQMASGINALRMHDMGLLHRDLKPENVLVDHAGCARLADPGAAYVHPYPLSPSEVYSSEVVGTRQYMAPEVVAICGLADRGREEEARAMMYGVGVDWWALGCMFFDMLSGTSLFADHADLKAYLSAFGKGNGLAFIQERLNVKTTVLEEDLLFGLLHAQEDRRYTFKHVAHAGYFWRDGHAYSEFEGLARRARAARSLYRPERAQYQNRGEEGVGVEVVDLFESTNRAMRVAEDADAEGEPGRSRRLQL